MKKGQLDIYQVEFIFLTEQIKKNVQSDLNISQVGKTMRINCV